MRHPISRLFLVPEALLVGALFLTVATGGERGSQDPDDDDLFEREVRPILEARCFECHGGGRRLKAGLRLTTREGLLAGGDSGPAVDLDEPDSSLVLEMISYVDLDHEMPPKGKLPEAEIDVLTRWIRAGAPYGADSEPTGEGEEPKRLGRDDGLDGWSYHPLTRPDVTEVANGSWVTNPIDAFLLARLEAAGLTPAGPADRVALIRRVTYDLIGLPPTPAEVDAFVADDSPDAYERLVERLLASPHYGEKWGRHWLDLVRYGETNGYERDSDKPFMWRYRDYVIDSFNQDKPYDRFILEQLAGDELDRVTPETITATGYYRLMIWDDEPGAGALQGRYDTLDDITKTTSEAFLGMTIGCARCHDHKGDPIPQKDYYRFMSFFHGLTDMSVDRHLEDIMSPEERAAYDAKVAARDAEVARLDGERRAIEEELIRAVARSDGELGAVATDLRDARYRFYRDTWERLPDFDALKAEDEGELASGLFDLAPATRTDSIGFVFEGELALPRPGTYRFRLATRGGGRLSIGDRVVIDHDGMHEPHEVAEATVELDADRVTVRLDYFHTDGEPALDLQWSPAELEPWRYSFEDPGDGWQLGDHDDSTWARGPGGFGSRGTPGAVVGTEWTGKDVWLRRPFEWIGEDADDLVFSMHHDEGAEVYVNGVLAAEVHGYKRAYFQIESTEEARRALRVGTNVLAVHCRNAAGGQYVHVQPVHRSRIGSAALVDLAFERRRLTPLDPRLAGPAIAELVDARGAELLGEERVARYRELGKELEETRKRKFPRKRAPAAQERGRTVEDLHVQIRGNANLKGERVEPAFPSALAPPPAVLPEPAADARTSGRRRVLAQWIASAENPLTARVMANRLWQHHFGRGLVASANDFGEFGDRPTHPELLDWLASELIERGWSLKSMHRLILSSSAYRMSSTSNGEGLAADPANELYWRFDMRRLTAEEMRDSMLAVNGRVNLELGGPSFFSKMPADVLATSSRPDAVWGESPDDQVRRRSVYIKVKRSLVVPILASFDLADTDASCPVRFRTTQPTQALGMVNGDFVNEQARAFAERLRTEAGTEPEAQVRRALRLVVSREPEEAEVARYVAFLEELAADHDDDDPLATFCLVALNLNEFAYLD